MRSIVCSARQPLQLVSHNSHKSDWRLKWPAWIIMQSLGIEDSVSLCVTCTESLYWLYAVKAQTSLAPLSRFRGSRVTTAHVHQCCRFQSYAKTVPSRMKSTKCEPHSWDLWQRTTWSRRVTSDFNSVLQIAG